MKKILLLVGLILISNAHSCLALTNDDFTSADYLKNYNYSDEMIRIVNIQKNKANGLKPTYKYNEPDWYTSSKPVNFIRKASMYFDCGLDDHKFGEGNNINFTTRWDDI